MTKDLLHITKMQLIGWQCELETRLIDANGDPLLTKLISEDLKDTLEIITTIEDMQ